MLNLQLPIVNLKALKIWTEYWIFTQSEVNTEQNIINIFFILQSIEISFRTDDGVIFNIK